MPIQLTEENGGKTLALHGGGTSVQSAHDHCAPRFERPARPHRKLLALVNPPGFHGWETSATWEDIRFATKSMSTVAPPAMIREHNGQQRRSTFAGLAMRIAVRPFDCNATAGARTAVSAA